MVFPSTAFNCFLATNVGDEGGFAPNIDSIYECLELIMDAISQAGHSDRVKIGLDVAASGIEMAELLTIFSLEFYRDGYYDLDFKSSKPESEHQKLSSSQMASLYLDLIAKYPSIFLDIAE